MPETRLVTAEELLAKDHGRCELVRGEIVEMTPPGRRHGRVTARIGRLLDEFIEREGHGEVLAGDPGFRLERDPDTVRAPDVAFVRADRLEGQDDAGYPELAPDLVVEVVSPSDSFREVEEKVRMWLGHGSKLVWVVEPELRQVFVYRSGDSRVDIVEGEEITGGDVLPGFSAPVDRFFP